MRHCHHLTPQPDLGKYAYDHDLEEYTELVRSQEGYLRCAPGYPYIDLSIAVCSRIRFLLVEALYLSE